MAPEVELQDEAELEPADAAPPQPPLRAAE